MRTWTLIRHGDPHTALELRERPDPVPEAHQVLIRCEGFGLNFADVMAVRGLYRDAPPLPSILGYEVVGHVVAVGTDVPAGMIGKRVVAMTRFGGYAELAATDHRACAQIPEDMPLGVAAALATQGCTAWYAAVLLAPLRAGQRVLVHSAAGGVGQLITQLALHKECEVFAVAGGQIKAEHLRALGVRHVVDHHTGPYDAAVRRALGNAKLDVSFNAVGGTTFKRDMALLGSGGRIVLYGGAERGGLGALGTLRFVWRMGLVVPIFLMMRSKSILGLNMLRISAHQQQDIAACLHGMVGSHRQGILRPHVHGEYPSGDLADALAALAAGNTVGKLVVRW